MPWHITTEGKRCSAHFINFFQEEEHMTIIYIGLVICDSLSSYQFLVPRSSLSCWMSCLWSRCLSQAVCIHILTSLQGPARRVRRKSFSLLSFTTVATRRDPSSFLVTCCEPLGSDATGEFFLYLFLCCLYLVQQFLCKLKCFL